MTDPGRGARRGGVPATGGLLDPDLLERLGGLELAARLMVEGIRGGVHRAPFAGRGEDFHRHRAYQQGDDLRHLDWKLLARTDRPWIREYRENTTLRCWLVLDATASMGYHSPGAVSKLRVAALIAAVLAHLMLEAGDAVGVARAGTAPELLLPPRNRTGQRRAVLLSLEALRPAGSTPLSGLLDRVGEALPRRGRVIVLSDLLEEDEGALMASLGRLASRGDEVVAVQILTPEERGRAPLPPALYTDPENPRSATPGNPGEDPGYASRVEAHSRRLEQGARGRGVEFLRIDTDQDPVLLLATWLRRRGGEGL